MDRYAAPFAFLPIFLLSVCSFPVIESQRFDRSLPFEELVGHKTEKLTHLHFYLYTKRAGPDRNVVLVAQASTTNDSENLFGMVNVGDEPILVAPNKTAKVIGRFQGLFASVSQTERVLMQAATFAFTVGKYNGSTLTMIGRKRILSEVREMPIVGGSGAFRFARGYAQVSTFFYNEQEATAILEYNVDVLHY